MTVAKPKHFSKHHRIPFLIACLLLAIFLLPRHGRSQLPKLNFKQLNIEQGLSNSTIECIFQDKRGFIWFGTRDGLNRYDGTHFVVYQYSAKDTNSISDNFIRSIYEDKDQTLWVGTMNGLNSFNKDKNNFTRYKHNASNNQSLSDNQVTCVLGDKKGNIWISTFGGGLNLFNPATKTFQHFQHDPANANSLVSDHINTLYEDSKENLWIGTENGLNLFDRKNKKITLYRDPSSEGNGNVSSAIRIISEDKMGNLWLATENNGLLLLDPVNKTFKSFRHEEKGSSSLANNQARSLLLDKKGDLWVGFINSGLSVLTPGATNFYNYGNEKDGQPILYQGTISALFEDAQQNMWIGTHRRGIYLYTPQAEKFKVYRHADDPNGISFDDPRSFCEDKKGRIWIGTDGGGLNLFDPATNIFHHYKHDAANAQSIGSNSVLDITEDSKGTLWLSTWGGGLNILHRETNTFTKFLNNPADKNTISSDYVQQVFEDHEKNIWVATYYGGLNLFNPQTKTFTRFTEDQYHQTQLSGDNIISLNEDRNGNLWIGTDDGGLNCYSSHDKRFHHYFNNEEKFPDLRVIFVDTRGRVWVGQKGLYLFDSAHNTFATYTDKAGLDHEFIKGIKEDDAGNLWISTSNGLTQFNPQTFSYRKYNVADGLQGMEFEPNACMKTRAGQMYFGGLNGFNVFYPKDIQINSFSPPVYITDFQIFSKRIVPDADNSPLQKDISETQYIKLNYKQATFTFSFAALNYTASENNRYAYKLEGLDNDWNYVNNERKASYTNLAPGNYTFRVKASNNDGVWNEEGAAVKISITPPFWNSWWFRSLLLAVIIAGVYAVTRFRRKLELNKLQEEKRKEIYNMQLQFFTNISHEFRTPLSLIIGPLEKLLKDDGTSQLHNSFRVMYRNATRLLHLINELMDFRKVEAGALKLKVMPGNLNLFLYEIAEEFSELAIEKNIHFTIRADEHFAEPLFDRQVLEKIIINLLSNAFKYTSDGGNITLEVLSSLDHFTPSFENELLIKNNYQAKKYFYIRIIDTGTGISKESLNHLFERYFKISGSHLGSGIGLAFVKSLTMLHKGHINVYSEKLKGTEIIIGIPNSNADYNSHERWLEKKPEADVQLESIHDHKHELPPPLIDEPTLYVSKTANAAHILIVDDNAELRSFLKEILSPFYSISEAADGNEGLQKTKEASPDLIISDVMMPVMDGVDFCKLVKEDTTTKQIPFLMLTAKSAIESHIQGTDAGADFYFSKPINIDLLLLTLRNIFTHKQTLKERYSKGKLIEAHEMVHSAKDKDFMEQLLAIIDQNITDPEMNVDFICSQIGMSKTKLYEKIKTISGQSISEFVRSVRLKKALEIMTHEDVMLTEVTYRVGIQTQSYFTKAFKKEFGKTPTAFMQELKK